MANQTEVITKEQHEQIERIKTYDAGCRGAFGQQMGYAYLAGMELNALKDRCKHGEFMKLRESCLPMIQERSAQRYMKFHTIVAETSKLPQFEDIKLLPDGHIADKDRERILKAVHKIADGKTLTELYRDLGVIRDREEKKHHPIKKLSPEEIIAAEQAQAEQLLENLLTPARQVHSDLSSESSFLTSRIPARRWKEAVQIVTALNKAMKPLAKKSKDQSPRSKVSKSQASSQKPKA